MASLWANGIGRFNPDRRRRIGRFPYVFGLSAARVAVLCSISRIGPSPPARDPSRFERTTRPIRRRRAMPVESSKALRSTIPVAKPAILAPVVVAQAEADFEEVPWFTP